ncbi:MAG: tetratricopeptide repeat protein [Lentisphaerae bacterium]|nr:tetratricopeptide repeat protein [Lentisphaerota bacterium]
MKPWTRRLFAWTLAAVVLLSVGRLLVAVSGNASADVGAKETSAGANMTVSARSAAQERIQNRLLGEKKKYEQLLRDNPGDEVALRKLVRTLLDLGEYKEAVRLVENVPLPVFKDTSDMPDFSPLPDMDRRTSPEVEASLLKHQTALMNDPTDEDALRALVLGLFRSGRSREALALLEHSGSPAPAHATAQAVQVEPVAPAIPTRPPMETPTTSPVVKAPSEAPIETAAIEETPGPPTVAPAIPDEAPTDPGKARAYFEARLRRDPGNEEALRGLVSALFALGEHDAALTVLEKGLPRKASTTVRTDVPAAPLPTVDTAAMEKGLVRGVAARDKGDLSRKAARTQLLQRIQALEEKSLDASRQLEDVNRALREEALKYEALFARGDAAEDELLERVQTREEEAKAATDRIHALSSRIAQERQEIAEAAGRSAQKQEELTGRIGELETEASTAVSELETARTELAAQRAKHAWLEGAIEERRAELELKVSQLEETIASEKEIGAVRKRFEEERAKRADMGKEHAAAEKRLTERISSLEETLRKTRATLANSRGGLDTHRKEYAALVREQSKTEVGMLEQIAKMEEDSRKATADLHRLRATLQEQEKEDTRMASEPLGRDADTRGIEIDLDLIYRPDAEQTDLNLSRAIARAAELGANTVYLRAFSDRDGNGSAEAVYFPTTPLQMRADLFGRAAEQFRAQGIAVCAAMPALSVTLTDQFKARKLAVMEYSPAGLRPAPLRQPRLSPFSRDALQLMMEIYSDLAASATIDGVLFLEDAYLTDNEDFNPSAREEYRTITGPQDVTPQELTRSQREEWTRMKTEKLEYFIGGLKEAVKRRQPSIQFTRALFAPALHRPESEEWLAQNYEDALKSYDRVIVVADPDMENIATPVLWLRSLVRDASAYDHGIDKTVFKVPSREVEGDRWIPERTLVRRVNSVLEEGARHAVYGPDDFEVDRPRMARIKTGMFND